MLRPATEVKGRRPAELPCTHEAPSQPRSPQENVGGHISLTVTTLLEVIIIG